MVIEPNLVQYVGHAWPVIAGLTAGAALVGWKIVQFIGYPKIEAMAKSVRKQVGYSFKKKPRIVGLLIHEPRHGAQCPRKPLIKGAVLGGTNIWIIVHPVGGNNFFVQPQPRVQRDGSWSVIGFVGEEGDNDVGHTYQIMAIGDPVSPLNRDDELRK